MSALAGVLAQYQRGRVSAAPRGAVAFANSLDTFYRTTAETTEVRSDASGSGRSANYTIGGWFNWLPDNATAYSYDATAIGNDPDANRSYGNFYIAANAASTTYEPGYQELVFFDLYTKRRFLNYAIDHAGYDGQWRLLIWEFEGSRARGFSCLPGGDVVTGYDEDTGKPQILNDGHYQIGSSNKRSFVGGLCEIFTLRSLLAADQKTALGAGATIDQLVTPWNYWKLRSVDDTTDRGEQGNDLILNGPAPGTMDAPSVLSGAAA